MADVSTGSMHCLDLPQGEWLLADLQKPASKKAPEGTARHPGCFSRLFCHRRSEAHLPEAEEHCEGEHCKGERDPLGGVAGPSRNGS